MTSSRRLPFIQFDVFTSRPLEGNPLAVFPDGRGLNDEEMQAIAREMNLSETTFILPRDAAVERKRGTRVRIFTVQEELPFADIPRWALPSLCVEIPAQTRSASTSMWAPSRSSSTNLPVSPHLVR